MDIHHLGNATYFVLFAILFFGILLGSLKIKGISLGISGILFVGLFFGKMGLTLDPDLMDIGLVIFIFTIGLEAGPQFFDLLKNNFLSFLVPILVLNFSALLLLFFCVHVMGLSKELSVGLLTGALTSTPGLAVALEYTNYSELASIGYGLSYPFGVIGVIIFIHLLPRFLKTTVKEAEKNLHNETLGQPLHKNYRLSHANFFNTTLGKVESSLHRFSGITIFRIIRENQSYIPNSSLILQKGDIITLVGTEKTFSKVPISFGEEIQLDTQKKDIFTTSKIFLKNKELVNRKIKNLDFRSQYNVTIGPIKRQGGHIIPHPNLRLHFDDEVTLYGPRDGLKKVKKNLGDLKQITPQDFFPLAFGIILGVVIGTLNIPYWEHNLGITEGVLLMAIILGKLGRTGPILWQMGPYTNNLMRQFGLILFLSVIGVKAGNSLDSTFQTYGTASILMGALFTIIPMLLTTYVAHKFFKLNLLTIMGLITGGMTSTPGLAVASDMTEEKAPIMAYALVYPLSIVVLIIICQCFFLS